MNSPSATGSSSLRPTSHSTSPIATLPSSIGSEKGNDIFHIHSEIVTAITVQEQYLDREN